MIRKRAYTKEIKEIIERLEREGVSKEVTDLFKKYLRYAKSSNRRWALKTLLELYRKSFLHYKDKGKKYILNDPQEVQDAILALQMLFGKHVKLAGSWNFVLKYGFRKGKKTAPRTVTNIEAPLNDVDILIARSLKRKERHFIETLKDVLYLEKVPNRVAFYPLASSTVIGYTRRKKDFFKLLKLLELLRDMKRKNPQTYELLKEDLSHYMGTLFVDFIKELIQLKRLDKNRAINSAVRQAFDRWLPDSTFRYSDDKLKDYINKEHLEELLELRDHFLEEIHRRKKELEELLGKEHTNYLLSVIEKKHRKLKKKWTEAMRGSEHLVRT